MNAKAKTSSKYFLQLSKWRPFLEHCTCKHNYYDEGNVTVN